MEEHKPIALTLTEHWKKEEELKSYNLTDFQLASFYCRKEILHGGAAVYVRHGTSWKKRNDLMELSEDLMFECAAIELILNNVRTVILSVYRTPNTDIDLFLGKIDTLLNKLIDDKVLIFLTGDFNVNILRDDCKTAAFLSLLSSYDLLPAIFEPTRFGSGAQSCIDNIFTNSKNFAGEILHTHISDHTGQKVAFELDGASTSITLNRRVFGLHERQLFRHMLAGQDWRMIYQVNESDVEEQWVVFMNLLIPIFNHCFLIKSFRVKTENKSYYNSPAVAKCKRELDVLLVLSRNDEAYGEAYKTTKLEYDKALKQARRDCYSQRILCSQNKSKSTWQIVNEVRGGACNVKDIDIAGSPQEMSNVFNTYMVGAAPSLVKNLKGKKDISNIAYNPNSMFVTPVTDVEILDIINSLKNKKSSGYDEISVNILKDCAKEISSPLSYIINNSFLHGIFPGNLKLAVVKPIYKKGDPALPESYRPISLLPTFSKIFEKAMCTRLMSFFSAHKLINPSQHGFLAGKSIETAVYDFVNEIVAHFESGHIALGSFLDLSKAFDCLDHALLLEKLERYGIRGRPLEWVQSYLQSRVQRVVIQKEGHKYFSDDKPVTMGVPQGSVMGPFLFICYINDLGIRLSNEMVTVVNYADDTSILVGGCSVDDVVTGAADCLGSSQQWFEGNSLLLNAQKSNFILFRTRQSNVVCPDSVELLSQDMPLSSESKFLGMYVDCHLGWEGEIEYVSGKLNACCYLLRVLRSYVDLPVLLTVYHANFNSILRYGNLMWGNSINALRVFKIQKRALRTMLGMHRLESCRGIFRRNNLLTLAGLHVYECVVFLRKNQHLFTGELPQHDHNTRSINYNIPSHRLTLSKRNPMYSCIKYYNKLPQDLKLIEKTSHFKIAVFQLLIEKEPYSVAEFLSGG